MGRRAALGRSGLSVGARLRRRVRKPLPLLICIDVEPDVRQVDPANPAWAGFELLLERVDELRDRVAAVALGPTVITWFVRADPQIADVHGDAGWAFKHYASELAALAAAGDEIGVHPHCYRREDDGSGWFVDHGDPAWVAHCFETGLTAYEGAFGHPPSSARGGDRFLDDGAVAALERAGVSADVTVEPRTAAATGVGGEDRSTGSLPDYSAAPEAIFRPRPGSFLTPGGDDARRLAMIPLTAGGPEVLYPWMDGFVFSTRLNERLAEGAGTHLAFAVRSDLPLEPVHWERCVENLGIVPHVAGVTADRRVRTMTAGALADSRLRGVL
jgi:hypothetical protein